MPPAKRNTKLDKDGNCRRCKARADGVDGKKVDNMPSHEPAAANCSKNPANTSKATGSGEAGSSAAGSSEEPRFGRPEARDMCLKGRGDGYGLAKHVKATKQTTLFGSLKPSAAAAAAIPAAAESAAAPAAAAAAATSAAADAPVAAASLAAAAADVDEARQPAQQPASPAAPALQSIEDGWLLDGAAVSACT